MNALSPLTTSSLSLWHHCVLPSRPTMQHSARTLIMYQQSTSRHSLVTSDRLTVTLTHLMTGSWPHWCRYVQELMLRTFGSDFCPRMRNMKTTVSSDQLSFPGSELLDSNLRFHSSSRFILFYQTHSSSFCCYLQSSCTVSCVSNRVPEIVCFFCRMRGNILSGNEFQRQWWRSGAGRGCPCFTETRMIKKSSFWLLCVFD